MAARNWSDRWLRPKTVSRLSLEEPLAALLDQLLNFLVALAARWDPDVLPLDPDEHRRKPPLAAELIDVLCLGNPTARRGNMRLAQAHDEEVQLERRIDEKRNPKRDPRLQPGKEEPGDDQHDRCDSQPPGKRYRAEVPSPQRISGRRYARSMAKVTIDAATGALRIGGEARLPDPLANPPPAGADAPSEKNGLAEVARPA